MTWAKSLKAAARMIFMGAVLFVPAGTLDWPGGWVFMAEMVAFILVTVLWLRRRDPALLEKRLSGPFQKGQVFWDKVFMGILVIVWYGWLVLMALDAKRWGGSHLPLWLAITGAVLIPAGMLLVLRTFRENSFAAPVVKIQEGQKVISTGPYAVVRHPMYASLLVYMLGIPLLLGSWLGLAILPLIVVLLMLRIPVEERALHRDLPGYDDYAARVRWRLVPGVW